MPVLRNNAPAGAQTAPHANARTSIRVGSASYRSSQRYVGTTTSSGRAANNVASRVTWTPSPVSNSTARTAALRRNPVATRPPMTTYRRRGREVGLGPGGYAERPEAEDPPGSRGVGAPEAMYRRLLQSSGGCRLGIAGHRRRSAP